MPKEVEIPVEHIQYVAKETGCKNVFGLDVPCLTEGTCCYYKSQELRIITTYMANYGK